MLLVICGKSGSGKTTLRNALLKENKELSKVVGYTTRQPRQNEVNGIDYHFVDKQDFEKNQNIILKRAVGESLYGVNTNSFHNNNTVLILDINGMNELKANKQNFKVVFLDISNQVVIPRLKERGDNLHEIKDRLSADKNLTLENLLQITTKNNILHITRGSVGEVLQETLSFIKHNQSNKNLKREKNFDRD